MLASDRLSALGLEHNLAQRYEDAEAAFRSALAQQPGHLRARWGLGHTLLSLGRYTEGWPLLRSRFELFPTLVKAPTRQLPEWMGEPLEGRSILVVGEQGFGDQIMFARFLKPLRESGAKVVLTAWPQLVPLLGQLADHVVSLQPGGSAGTPPFDCWTHSFSLPERLGVTLDNLPAAPYLKAEQAGDAGGSIGLFWQTKDSARSLPEALVSSLLKRGLVSLQPEDTGAKNFAETAAIIDRMSLVVTMDTAVAHLAGAMGKPVWILLPWRGLDWRWMRTRADSPWYPSARLFRQEPGENWEAVIERIIAALP